MQAAECRNCRWFRRVYEHLDYSVGECRRHAPTRDIRVVTERRLASPNFADNNFPIMEPKDWCGDWTAKEQNDGTRSES